VIASEIIKQVALLDVPLLADEALTEIADALFVEHDKMEAEDPSSLGRYRAHTIGGKRNRNPCL